MSSDKPPAPIVEAETFESTPSTSDPTFKYYQVAVPSFSFNQTGDDTGVTRTVANVAGDPTAGSSFIRLGAFPDVTNPTKGPAGFAASLALANLVGDATAISGAETTDVSPSTLGGDPNYLLGFADDTRVHKAPLPPNQGQAETLLLLTKGGWWEHSDGNRISTTAGDRVDIIQGNYKMVVIGRQPTDPTPLNAAAMSINDISGGLQEVNGPGATPVIRTTEWTQDQGGLWTVYQDNGIGNVVTSSYGSSCAIAAGPLLETWTGLAPPGFPQSEAYINSQAQRGTEAPAGVPSTAPYGVVNSNTWAESITTYVGSEQMLIPVINAYTYAESMLAATGSVTYPVTTLTSTTFADTMLTATGSAAMPVTTLTSTTYADTMLTVTGSAAAPVATMTSTTFAGVSNAITTAEAITAVTTAAAVTNVTTAAAVTSVTTAAALTTVNLAANTATLNVGALVETINVAGLTLGINLGPAFNLTVPDATNITPQQVHQHLQKIETAISNLHTSVQHVHSALVHELVAAAVFLGLP